MNVSVGAARVDVRAVVAAAINHHQRGQYQQAEALYREVLRVQPLHFDALQLLGALKIDTANYAQGAELIRSAIGIKPGFAKAHVNLGVALSHLGEYESAIASYDRALVLMPKYPEAYVGRGNAHTKLERTREALADFDRALALRPAYVQALGNKAAALLKSGEWEGAVQVTSQAISLRSATADILMTRGDALRKLARYADATRSYDEALALDSRRHEALHGRAQACFSAGDYEGACASLERALQIKPDVPEIWSDCGSALAMLGRIDEAMRSFERALELRHGSPTILANRGVALLQLRRFSDALDSFDKSLAYDHGQASALNGCAKALLGLDLFERAVTSCDLALLLEPDNVESLRIKAVAETKLRNWDAASTGFSRILEVDSKATDVLGLYLLARLYACSWEGLASEAGRLKNLMSSGDVSAVVPLLLSVIDCDLAQQQAGARAYARTVIAQSAADLGPCLRYQHAKIRLAYVSADYREHPVGRCLVQLLEQHDRSRFEVIGIALGPGDDSELRKRIESACDDFRHVDDRSDVEVTQLLRELEIDIAVDLMGYTDRSRSGIFALRAAPCQVNFMGYPGTLGASFMDYIIADEYVIPPEHGAYYDERVVRMPGCYFVHDTATTPADATPARATEGLPETGFVFCCFNSAHKLNPRFFSSWMQLLRAVDGAVLWLQGGNEDAERNLKREAAQAGVDPTRLVFARRADRIEDHLARHRLADLFLDTGPYNAHSTARDALWAGLPVLTLEGNTFASRVAGSLLRAAGMPELIAKDHDEYASLALQLASDPAKLEELRSKLQALQDTAPLFNTQRRREHLEAAYQRMHEIAVREEEPQGFAVGELSYNK